MRNEAIGRSFAIGMDMPSGDCARPRSGPGILLRTTWTSWQIEEASIKLHIEPMLEIIDVGPDGWAYLTPATPGTSPPMSTSPTTCHGP